MKAKKVNESSAGFYKNHPFGNAPHQIEIDRENARLARKYDSEKYWAEVAAELGAEIDGFEPEEEARSITFRMPNGDIMDIIQTWEHDGSPVKPVTYIDGQNLGRFAIWDNPAETAEDYLEIWNEYTKYDDEIDESVNEENLDHYYGKGTPAHAGGEAAMKEPAGRRLPDTKTAHAKRSNKELQLEILEFINYIEVWYGGDETLFNEMRREAEGWKDNKKVEKF